MSLAAREDLHLVTEGEPQQQVGAGVSVLDQADHPCPARIPIDNFE